MGNYEYLITKNSINPENHIAPENKRRQVMYLYHYNQARVCHVCCSGKAVNFTYMECVFVTFGILQRVMCVIVLSVACLAHSIFPHHTESRI